LANDQDFALHRQNLTGKAALSALEAQGIQHTAHRRSLELEHDPLQQHEGIGK
jgi:hypothetical protein